MKLKWPGFDAKTVAAIEEYLQLDEMTEIVWRQADSVTDCDYRRMSSTGMANSIARGRAFATNYGRPMVQVFDDGASSAMAGYPKPSCPACDDWSRTTACDVHPELPLDDVLRRPDEFADQPYYGPENNPALPRRREPVALSQVNDAVTALRYGFEVSNQSPVWTIVRDARSRGSRATG